PVLARAGPGGPGRPQQPPAGMPIRAFSRLPAAGVARRPGPVAGGPESDRPGRRRPTHLGTAADPSAVLGATPDRGRRGADLPGQRTEAELASGTASQW